MIRILFSAAPGGNWATVGATLVVIMVAAVAAARPRALADLLDRGNSMIGVPVIFYNVFFVVDKIHVSCSRC
jgi:hypothetical protein